MFSPNTVHCTILINNHSLKLFRRIPKRKRKAGRILKLSRYNRTSLQHGFAGFSCQWQMLVGIDAHHVDAPLQTHQSQFNNPQASIQIPHSVSGRAQLALLPVPNHFILPHRMILNLAPESQFDFSLSGFELQACALSAPAYFPPANWPSSSKIHRMRCDRVEKCKDNLK